MVLKFDLIPPHLQQHIAEMMDFTDFQTFQESSKRANAVGHISTPTIDIFSIVITMEDISLSRSHKQILWSSTKLHKNAPRFCVRVVRAEQLLTQERCLEIMRFAEAGYFTAKNAILDFNNHDMALNPEVFNRILEVFNVTQLMNVKVKASYMQLPCMKKIVDFFLVPPTEEEILFSLRASTIAIKLIAPDINATMNRFFKEWLNGEREILKVDLFNYNFLAHSKVADIFADIPHTILWNRAAPNSGLPTKLALNQDEGSRLTFVFKSYFSLQRGNKTLFVAASSQNMAVKEVVDAEKEFLNELNVEYAVNLFDRYAEYKRSF